MIEYTCPNCSHALESPLSLAGATDTCPQCGELVSVPSSDDELYPMLPETEPLADAVPPPSDAWNSPVIRLALKALEGAIAAFAWPWILFNMLAGFVAAIWLFALWKWDALLVGLASLFSPPLLGFVGLPGFLLSVAAITAWEKGHRLLAIILGVPSVLYTQGLVAAWCIGAIYVFLNMADDGSRIPTMLLAYVAGTGPWAYMASKDAHSGTAEYSSSSVTVFFAQLGCAAAIGLIIFFRARLQTALAFLVPIVCLGTLLQLFHLMTLSAGKERNRSGSAR